MALVLVGINHKTAPLQVRERVSFTKRRIKESLIELKQKDFITGAVILFTCNRTEIYIESKEKREEGKEQIIKFLYGSRDFTEDDFTRYFYTLEDVDLIGHLFRVASGLDSQVLGENQILGQVKSAWMLAKELGASSAMLDKVFEKAINVGKQVRMETKISCGNVSIGSVAITMLERKLKDLRGKSILIIGAGKIGTLVSKYLKERHSKGIFVSNRTYTKAKELASACKGIAINFDQLKDKLIEVDAVISSTASPHFVLRKELLLDVMQLRKKPLLIMDLALPRDIDPEVKNIPDISLFDLDDLKSIIEENYARRKKEIKFAEAIIQMELSK